MKQLLMIVLLAIVLAGCTHYGVHRTTEGVIDISVWSTRSFEQPDMSYTRTGKDATFDFKAAGVDNNTDAIVGMFAPIIQAILTGSIVVAPLIPEGENQ